MAENEGSGNSLEVRRLEIASEIVCLALTPGDVEHNHGVAIRKLAGEDSHHELSEDDLRSAVIKYAELISKVRSKL